ncbi:MAG TPA: hypothetical protein VII66_04630, partial [Gemmatimonadaceae bacterium]
MMLHTSQFITIAAMIATSVSIASAQGATSLTKPISLGISAGASIPTGEFSNGGSGGFTGVNTGYNITGSLSVGLPVVP